MSITLQGLQLDREEAHIEMAETRGIWRMTGHQHIVRLLDHQAAELSRVRTSVHEPVFRELVRAQDEAMRAISGLLDVILQVCWGPAILACIKRARSMQEAMI